MDEAAPQPKPQPKPSGGVLRETVGQAVEAERQHNTVRLALLRLLGVSLILLISYV